MSWREAGTLLAVITLANIAGVLWSQSAKLWVWVLYGIGGLTLVYVAGWRRRRRLAALTKMPAEEQATKVASLAEEEQALTRMALDLVTPDQILRVPIDGQVFEYQRTPPLLRAMIFWGCVLMSGLPLVQLALGYVSASQQLPALAVGFGFALGAFAMHYTYDAEAEQIIVTPVGLIQRKANGQRVGILWSEVASVRSRPILTMIEVHTADGRRRIRIGSNLQRFKQFLELLVSAMKWIDERAA